MSFTTITNSFDLPIMQVLQGSDSMFLDSFMLATTNAATWFPLYIMLCYLVVKNNENMKQIALVIGFAILMVGFASYVANILVKPMIMRPRPTNDILLKYTIDVVANYRETAYSFFSAHATNTMAIATFFCLLVRSGILTTILYSWALLNCYTRIYLGVHYPSDVIVGILWGLIVGIGFHFLWRYADLKLSDKSILISEKYTTTGYAYQEVYITGIVFILTLIYAIFYATLQF